MRRVSHSSRHIVASSIERAVAEVLEPRRLFAAIESGILVARGTGGNDTIALRRTGTDDVIVTTNGVNQTFDMDNFTGVRLEGLAGNDTFQLINALTSPVVRNTTVLGGAGDDTVDYSARSTALTFNGYQQGDSATPFPYVRVTSGAQEDRVDAAVERFIGGSAADHFTFDGLVLDTTNEQNVVLEGRGGNDIFDHVADMDVTMRGGAGDDRFVADDERVHGTRIEAGDGNDIITLVNLGLPGELDGGAGVDEVRVYSSNLPTINMAGFVNVENLFGAGDNVQTVFGNFLGNRIVADGGTEHVTLNGLGGNDTLIGNNGRDSLNGGAGNDSLSGGLDDDLLDGETGTDTLDGGIGDDTLLNGEVTPPPGQIRILNGILTADGTWGGEEIRVRRVGTDDVEVSIDALVRTFDMDDFTGILLRGNDGYDFIDIVGNITAGALTRKVTLEGGNGNDILFGENGDDVLRGGEGNDVLFGEGGNDALFGGGGNDTDISGGPGNDFIDGGDGDDAYLESQDGEVDTVVGGAGNDFGAVDAIDQRSGIEQEDVAV